MLLLHNTNEHLQLSEYGLDRRQFVKDILFDLIQNKERHSCDLLNGKEGARAGAALDSDVERR